MGGVYIGVDYGQKRTGIAISDPTHTIASPLETVSTQILIDYLMTLYKTKSIEAFVVGEPKRSFGSHFDIETEILKFIKQFQKKCPKSTVIRYDERFTSKIAKQSIITMGMKKKQRQNKELIDQISASIILQDYLNTKQSSKQL